MTFTPPELAMIRHAVQDYAGRWYGQVGAMTFGRDDAARYVSEGHLGMLCDRYTLKQVWRAVAEVINEDPAVLELRLSDAEVEERAAARRAAADEIDQRAAAAFHAGDLAGTLALIDEAELAAPTYRNWDDLRRLVRERLTPARDPR
ncbi:hypothetical protein [Phytohabitans houttuyneae]|uniref:Uncharacterized protein n=1 Tax=Phytohabitans houttuyneae TaxID=1076126 RepID=A0A6V8KBT1_9ACTN|nr:hypothetical protein [Phytohabitans houttuyneae]GFJ79436.1 hypothetical protein Phou_036160 [Phytohabitans houttuyneae]